MHAQINLSTPLTEGSVQSVERSQGLQISKVMAEGTVERSALG
jgi:hypothetical protein